MTTTKTPIFDHQGSGVRTTAEFQSLGLAFDPYAGTVTIDQQYGDSRTYVHVSLADLERIVKAARKEARRANTTA